MTRELRATYFAVAIDAHYAEGRKAMRLTMLLEDGGAIDVFMPPDRLRISLERVARRLDGPHQPSDSRDDAQRRAGGAPS